MDDQSGMKFWVDAGHVARRTLDAVRPELQAGKSWVEIIDFAERFIRRNGGQPAFPTTIAVNEIAAHFTPDHADKNLQGWEDEMVLQKGDLVKIDVGVHINGHIGDNAMTVEIGNGNSHTEQIKAAKESRDAAIEKLHPEHLGMRLGRRRLNQVLMPVFNQSEIYVDINSNHGSFTRE